LKIGSLGSEKIIIGSLELEKIGSPQVHTGCRTFSLKKTEVTSTTWSHNRRKPLCETRSTGNWNSQSQISDSQTCSLHRWSHSCCYQVSCVCAFNGQLRLIGIYELEPKI